MNKEAKIYVAGHRGLVGSAIVQDLQQRGYKNIIFKMREELDLTQQAKVEDFFKREKPEYVFLAAAKVGGIQANNKFPAEFIRDNLIIQHNIIEASYRTQVRRLLFLGSSCIYPKNCPQPIKESGLLTGMLEPTNRPYAIAKIAGIEQCWAYNRQFDTQFLCVMPTNLYGPGDHYDLKNSHVLPALIRKVHEAKLNNHPQISIWGTGNPRREFLFIEDLAKACFFLMNLNNAKYTELLNKEYGPIINVGVGKDIAIAELVEIVKEIIGYEGSVVWDVSKPDGTIFKRLDVSEMTALGWTAQVSLRDGINITYEFYKKTLELPIQ